MLFKGVNTCRICLQWCYFFVPQLRDVVEECFASVCEPGILFGKHMLFTNTWFVGLSYWSTLISLGQGLWWNDDMIVEYLVGHSKFELIAPFFK